MPYSVTTLINEAFYTSGVVSRLFQTVSGDQFETGFIKLNEILTDTGVDGDFIPYFNSSYTFNAVAGQEQYFIPNLTQAETLTFFIQSIRYQMRKNPRDQYFGAGRAQNVLSLPFNWHVERVFGGSNLFIYFFPDTNFPMELTGLFRLGPVTATQDLSSALATAVLGYTTVGGTGTFGVGQLVVNGVDLAGTYATSAAFVAFINTGVVPFISALLEDGIVSLSNRAGGSIRITTTGNEVAPNFVTFSNFSTMDGPLDQTFIATALDQYYINYLQYKLADRICTAYNMEVPAGAAKQLDMYEIMIGKRSSPMDMTMNKISTITNKSSINYAQVNLGKGWTI